MLKMQFSCEIIELKIETEESLKKWGRYRWGQIIGYKPGH